MKNPMILILSNPKVESKFNHITSSTQDEQNQEEERDIHGSATETHERFDFYVDKYKISISQIIM